MTILELYIEFSTKTRKKNAIYLLQAYGQEKQINWPFSGVLKARSSTK